MSLAVTKRGNVVYEPDGEVLERYLWSRGKLDVIQGPIGSGTSTASLHRLWLMACEQEPDRDGVRRTSWVISRETYPMLKESILSTTWPQWFPEEEWGVVVRSEPMSVTLRRDHPSRDGTSIEARYLFLALPNEEIAEKTLPSMEITGFFMNEGQFQSLGVVLMLLSRCGRYPSMKGGPGPTWFGGMIDLNAPEEGHWIPYMRGDLPVPPDWPEETKRQFEKPDSWNFFVQPPGLLEDMRDGRVMYRPNPRAENQRWLKEPYIEKIQGWDRQKIDQLVLNKVALSRRGKPVYPTFLPQDHVAPEEIEPRREYPIIVGMDFGRDPAAIFCQCVNETWYILSELIGDNESAERFAPRVARHLSQRYPGFDADFWGDPRGADRGQNVEITAYDIFQAQGMRIIPASTDNSPELRRAAMERVLGRRRGLQVSPSVLTFKTGMMGGYHYRAIKGVNGMFTEKPVKNGFSHVVESFENAVLGGGEGMIRSANVVALKPSPIARRRVALR